MALIIRKEFIEKFGLKNAHFTTYRDRGNIVVTKKEGEEYVDDSHPVNIAFIAKRTDKKAATAPTRPPKTTKTDTKNITAAAGLPEDIGNLLGDDDAEPKPTGGKGGLYEQYTASQIAKNKQQTRILAIQEEKLLGLLIPKDTVLPVIQRFAQALLTTYSQAFENFIVEVEKIGSVPPDVIAAFRLKARKELNTAVTDGIEATEADIEHIVNEYAAKRGRGQRKTVK